MGCGPSTDTNHSPNAPQQAESELSNEASIPNDEPQAGDETMLSRTELDEILNGNEAICITVLFHGANLISAWPCLAGMEKEEKERLGEELHNAAMDGNVEELGRLLSTDKGRACFHENKNGVTLLHYAATTCKLEAVKFLVERGADIDLVSELDEDGTPLTQAAQYGYESIAEYLLSKGAIKEKAIGNAPESQKALVENFFVELERVLQNRQELKIKCEELKATMMSSKEPETLPTTCKGITIGGLRKMKALMQSECEAGRFKEDKSFSDGTHCKGTMKYEELTTTDIVYCYVKDESVTGKLRLIDTGLVAPEHKRMPTFFISHAWKGRFSVLLDMIFAYAEKYGLSEEAAIWIDVFSVNQHGSKDCSELSQTQNQADVQASTMWSRPALMAPWWSVTLRCARLTCEPGACLSGTGPFIIMAGRGLSSWVFQRIRRRQGQT